MVVLINKSDETAILPEGFLLGHIEEIEDEPITVSNAKEMAESYGIFTQQANLGQSEVITSNYLIQEEDLKDLNIGPLNTNQKKLLEELLVQNGDLFAKEGEPPGRTGIIKHHIFTGDAAPIIQRAYKSNL